MAIFGGFNPGPAGPPPGPPPRTQTDPAHDPQAFTSLPAGRTVDYASQGNGLTAAESLRLSKPVRILDANQQFFDHWKELAKADPGAGAGPLGMGGFPSPMMAMIPSAPKHYAHTQIESDRVRVLSPSQENLVRQDGNRLKGDPAVISAFQTAQSVDDSAQGFLGRKIEYRSEDKQLHVYVNTPTAADAHYGPGTGAITLSKSLSAPDPDTVAHEQGHAIMDAIRPGITSRDKTTVAASEGFADSVALIHSLGSKEVRTDALNAWGRGQNSTLASNIGEATHAGFAAIGKEKAPPVREGIRDLGQAPPTKDLKEDDGHQASRQFSSAVYGSVRDLTAQIRKDHPDLTADQALLQARQAVGSDLHRSLEFLPNTNVNSQEMQAQAMMKAGQVDRSGSNHAIYMKNFKAAGLDVKDEGPGMPTAQVAALGKNPALDLPKGLRDYELTLSPTKETGKKDEMGFPVYEGGKVVTTDSSQAMQAYLAKNHKALGIPEGMVVERITHNDRGEFSVLASNMPSTGPMRAMTPPVGQGVVLNFDHAGKLNYVDMENREARGGLPTAFPGFP